jgi:hypothetical protein
MMINRAHTTVIDFEKIFKTIRTAVTVTAVTSTADVQVTRPSDE